MDATPTSNNRIMNILIALLLMVLLILTLNIGFWLSMMNGGIMMGGGMMNHMMGMDGQTMNDMMTACTDMMRNFQNP